MLKKPTTVFVYLLGAYVLIQFLWWGYHLIDLTQASQHTDKMITKRIVMIIGEGSVFLILLLFGLWKIKRSIKKEIQIARQQNNFMLSVTHELKTPLAATKLYLQTVQKHKLSEEKQNELIQKALDESSRLENLVEQILTASRLEQQALPRLMTAISLKDFLNDLISIQEKRFNISIKINDFEDIQLETDMLIFSNILNNLVENGYKYGNTKHGLSIHVSKENNQYVSIQIRDFGKGIPFEQQDLLFKKFNRLENEETRTTKGTGLGLFIARECARTLGGSLRLIKVEGPGACFEIQMPYDE
ncbi:sensor histidine kinase [Fluviicola taffensis]|uniref:histidine kinase n=1 Tax=Fluviicola taffensis (strain DSM 16823 / NCIMB 13979 / RW262) TaxID=755732 RepID=F2IK93_FLUTR|nr:HAMP domain-containing sensor histidine kinase [Fluviicola taffensis]AEA43996.1 integral membrane sensor signal transduction histidine kinase [Fluviicola taffensis DSM 16823]